MPRCRQRAVGSSPRAGRPQDRAGGWSNGSVEISTRSSEISPRPVGYLTSSGYGVTGSGDGSSYSGRISNGSEHLRLTTAQFWHQISAYEKKRGGRKTSLLFRAGFWEQVSLFHKTASARSSRPLRWAVEEETLCPA